MFVISVPTVFKVRSSRSVSVHSKFKDSLDPVSKLGEKKKAEKSGRYLYKIPSWVSLMYKSRVLAI